jgi:hypothetical protein
MRRLRTAVIVVLLGVVWGCAPTPTAPPPPGRLLSQPYDEPVLVAWGLGYADTLHGALPFDIESRTRAESVRLIDSNQADLLITSGDPPAGWFATPLGRRALAIIVHPDNPVRDLTSAEVGDLFSGKTPSWNAVGGDDLPVQPVLPLPDEPARDRFEQVVLGAARPWPGTLLAPTPDAAVETVRDDPGAIGVVPLEAATSDVRIIRLDGVLPGPATVANGRYPLTVDLIATSPDEPAGALRDFLVWIESAGANSGG